jgi:chemotaxis protein MotB
MRAAGRRRPTGEASGDSYLASVSDLMSALIFIFIITLAVFALRLAKVTETKREETEQLRQTNRRLNSADQTRRQILEDIAKRLKDAGIKVEVLHEQGVLRLSQQGIYCPSGSEEPHDAHAERVGHLARVLAEVIPCYVTPTSAAISPASRASYCSTPAKPSCNQKSSPSYLETLLIEGHTDTQPVSRGRFRFRDNLELSSMRAATVYRMIKACEPGITELRNNKGSPVLGISGYGAMRLAKRDDPLAEENRRIDLRFLMEPPTLDEAKSDPAKAIPDTGETPVQTEIRRRYEGN